MSDVAAGTGPLRTGEDDQATDEHAPDEYRIDELAREAGATVRNVRAYQDRGLLPPPRRAGRVGWYSASHLARLRLIGELLGRGYTLANIAEMLHGWERGQDLGELLGLESALIGPWSEDRSAPADPAELAGLLGGIDDPQVLAEAQRLGVVEVIGDEIRVKNPKVLETAATLVQAGVPLGELLGVLQTVSTAMEQVAASFVEMAVDHLFAPFGNSIPAAEVPRLAGLVRTLRPLATSVVDGELARAMERRIQAEMGALFSREQRSDQAAS